VCGLAEQVEQLGAARERLLDLQCGDKGLIDPCVSGSAAYGHAVNEARGEWIAPLGSDDEFLPHHLERLLAVALERNAELAYGKLERVGPTGAARYMYAFPPERGRVAAEQAIYLRTLSSFAHDPCARVPAEPGEWTVIDRMWAAGVRVAGIDELVTRSYSSTAKSQSGDPEVNLRFRSGSGDRQTVRVSMTGAKRHDSAKVWARCDTLEIRTGNAPWAYAAVVPLPELGVVPLAIRATIVVSAGRVGVALLRVSDEIAVEFFLDEQQDDQVIELPVREPDGVWRFLVRNHAFPGPMTTAGSISSSPTTLSRTSSIAIITMERSPTTE
jgi:hypothetical protein